MIRAATFVLGGLVVLSAMDQLNFALAVENPRSFYQQCKDEGYETHCLYTPHKARKYMCKSLVCAKNEGGIMLAINTEKPVDDGTPCGVILIKGRISVTRVCFEGVCHRVSVGTKIGVSGSMGDGEICHDREGNVFDGGTVNRAVKCPKISLIELLQVHD